MLAELIISYALITNEPVLLRSYGEPYARQEVALNVEQKWYDVFFVKLRPYVQGSERNTVERAGAYVEVGMSWPSVDISLYHHSSHNLDRPGEPLEVDGIRVRWRLN